ncbi:MAG: 2Fe-2S iron-sulfur cluster-binding protein [Chitinophagaceae bacterium]
MVINKIVIHFTAYYEGEKYELQTYEGEYRNLMVLLYDKIYIEDFGECKGMGRCGTCAVKVEGLPEAVNALERNEERTLYKMGIQGGDIRLACQILVDETLENVIVKIIGGESVEYI